MAETALSQMAVYNPRPTVRVDGQTFDKVSDLVIGMDMQEQEGGLAALELRLSNIASDPQGGGDFAFESEEEIRLGSTVSVYGGDVNEPQEIFNGIITGLESEFPAENPPELLVLAEDKLQAARMTRRTATYNDISLADLVQTIASRMSVIPQVTGLSETIGTWVQLNESDLAFLRRLIRRYDGDLQIVGSELHVSPRSEVQRGLIELELHSQLRSVKFIADLAEQVTEVTVAGWDPLSGRRITAASTGVNLGPGLGRDGAGILRDVIGERNEHVGHVAVNTDAEARALADMAFDQRARRFVCAEGTTEGNPRLRVGTHLKLTGVSPRFANTYYVVAARHRYDINQGYETDFKAESYALGNV